MKKVAFILVFYGIALLVNQPTFAQQSRWQFIGKNDNGSLSYLEKSSQNGSGNRKRTWVKEVYSDRSYKIILIDWQCRERKFQAVESTSYAGSGEYIDKEGSSPWTAVVPDSVVENYYQAVCVSIGQTPTTKSDTSSNKMMAQVIAQNANVRESPTTNSRVIQNAAKGTRFIVADAEPTGSWYQVFIPNTIEIGWLHGNTIKLITVEPESTQPKRKSKPIRKRGRVSQLAPIRDYPLKKL